MSYDSLELAILQYLDGTLPPQERIVLEQRLATDPEAQKLLAEHRSLNAALQHGLTIPALQWDRFAEQISAAVHEQAQQQPADVAIEEHIEFAITQYLDADLPSDERSALEQRLDADPAAQRVFEQHQALDAAIRLAWPIPQVNWDAFAGQISDAIAESAERSAYSIAWARRAVQLAVAACVLIATGLGIYFSYPTTTPTTPQFAEIAGPAPEPAAGAPLVHISIGAPGASGYAQIDPYSSGIVSLPSRVQIALDTHGLPESGPFAQ